jgi:hypothetical protein
MAAALAEMGCDIITGGGPGLMQAANEGAAVAVDPPLASPKDFAIPQCVASADEAIARLRECHAAWRRETTR